MTGAPVASNGIGLGNIIFVLFVLSLVILLIGVSRYVFIWSRRFSAKGPKTRRLSIRESLFLDPKRRLVTIDYRGRNSGKTGILLLGGNRDLFLGWVDETPALADSVASGSVLSVQEKARTLDRKDVRDTMPEKGE